MKIIKGNKKINLSETELLELTSAFNEVIIDIGTGDGRFVYKNALLNKGSFYIGIDPSEKSLEEYSKKAVKAKINNVLFVVGSIELLPDELMGKASSVVINLPWGSLLQAVIKPTIDTVTKIKSLFSGAGFLTIILGYHTILEPGETKRLNLEPITKESITKNISPYFEENGFKLQSLETISPQNLKSIESTWGKRIALRPDRPIFKLSFKTVL